ncbi:PREDICTED: uncharacterized protein LOC109164434 [Ipomoea nil]|uniref:uncharacterized protein LOC109164434 n=1 Tax=Ipomoea nil TaxID=35883 RepID=UPI0009012E53|nr:PREDICTED: uncharacterized protein LOC109164434 [Ipomoea nil]
MAANVEREREEPNRATRPLHNFTLPSCLKWGHQKHIRRKKLGNSSGVHPDEHDGSNQVQRISSINPVADDGDIEKLMTDLHGDKKPSEEEDSNPAAAGRRSLRSRRAGDRTGKVVNLALQPQKSKFSIALSREEIEADFTAITGVKPPRKPKKRPRAIQKEIDDLFPGSWLMEVTPDKYKVLENPDHSRVRDKDNAEEAKQ